MAIDTQRSISRPGEQKPSNIFLRLSLKKESKTIIGRYDAFPTPVSLLELSHSLMQYRRYAF